MPLRSGRRLKTECGKLLSWGRDHVGLRVWEFPKSSPCLAVILGESSRDCNQCAGEELSSGQCSTSCRWQKERKCHLGCGHKGRPLAALWREERT